MAHSCPNCDSYCHCNGDIDDICLPGGEDACKHCPYPYDDDEDDDDWRDDLDEIERLRNIEGHD